MKKVLLVLAMVALTFSMNAQVDYDTYAKGAASIVIEPGKTQGTIYLDLNTSGTYGVIIKKGEGEEFVNFLQTSFDKFQEWATVAVENNVTTEMTKEISRYSRRGYFRYGGWKFGYSNISMNMNIKDGKIRAYLYGEKIVAGSNKYIKSESVLFFIDQATINQLKTIFSTENIDAFINSKNQAANLFN